MKESGSTMWIQITSGRGPVECQWVVGQLLATLVEEARTHGVGVELLEAIAGDGKGLLLSALVVVEGPGAAAFVEGLAGTIQWTGQSAFRPHHRRRNYFIGVESFSLPVAPDYSDKDLVFETMRGSGPGGQHVNKTESCVRVTHVPTGLSAIGREERSQQQNRKLALARLQALREEQGDRAVAQSRRERWDQHNALTRGNPVRVYQGPRFVRRG